MDLAPHRANFEGKPQTRPLPLKKARPGQRHHAGPRCVSPDTRNCRASVPVPAPTSKTSGPGARTAACHAASRTRRRAWSWPGPAVGRDPGGAGRAGPQVSVAAQPGDRVQPRADGLATDPATHLAVDQPRGLGAEVEDGDGAGGERDRDPGLGDLASRRRVDGHLPRAGYSVQQRVQSGVGVARLRTRLHPLQRGSARRCLPGDCHHHLGRDITWRGAGGAGGVLPPLYTTAVAAFRVAKSQALDTSGGT